MRAVIARIGELLRYSSSAPPVDPARALTIDLGVAAAGFAIFGASIAAGGGVGWNLLVSLKVAGAFLTAFVLCLPPLYSLKRFFDVEATFGEIVSVFAGHLALGGVFASAGAGLFLLLSRGEVNFDGALAVAFVAAAVAGVLVCRARSPLKWLTPLPAALAVTLYLGLLAQSAWAFRPYMDPESPTLFQARLEWFAGKERAALERLVVRLAGERGR